MSRSCWKTEAAIRNSSSALAPKQLIKISSWDSQPTSWTQTRRISTTTSSWQISRSSRKSIHSQPQINSSIRPDPPAFLSRRPPQQITITRPTISRSQKSASSWTKRGRNTKTGRINWRVSISSCTKSWKTSRSWNKPTPRSQSPSLATMHPWYPRGPALIRAISSLHPVSKRYWHHL